MSRSIDDFSDHAMGARIVGIDEIGPNEAYVDLEHRGTDIDAFRIAIDVREIEWRDPASGEYSRAERVECSCGNCPELDRLVDIAEHLFQMVPVEVWRASGGDDGQGHYEGDYHAERLREELARLRSGPEVDE